MSNGRFTQKQREACFERAKGRCEVCGNPLPEKGWNLHHRQGRGMGGTKRAMTCADGLAVCGSGTTGCHGHIEANRQWAETWGYLVRRPQIPAEVPLYLRDEGWVWFRADGSVTHASEWGEGTA